VFHNHKNIKCCAVRDLWCWGEARLTSITHLALRVSLFIANRSPDRPSARRTLDVTGIADAWCLLRLPRASRPRARCCRVCSGCPGCARRWRQLWTSPPFLWNAAGLGEPRRTPRAFGTRGGRRAVPSHRCPAGSVALSREDVSSSGAGLSVRGVGVGSGGSCQGCSRVAIVSRRGELAAVPAPVAALPAPRCLDAAPAELQRRGRGCLPPSTVLPCHRG